MRVDRHLRRVFVFGRRLHHGATGAVLVAVGSLLMAHDRRDLRDWFKFNKE